MPKFDDYAEASANDLTDNDKVLLKDSEPGATKGLKFAVLRDKITSSVSGAINARLVASNNLSDLTNKPNARANLGIVVSDVAVADDLEVSVTGGVATIRRAAAPTGSAHQLPFPHAIQASTAYTVNEVRVTRFTPSRRLKISSLAFYVSTLGTGACNVGIWSIDGTTLLASTGAVSTATAGRKIATFAPVTLDPSKEYLLAVTLDNTTARIYSINVGALGNFSDANVPIFGLASNAASAGVFPGTLGTISYNSVNLCPSVMVVS